MDASENAFSWLHISDLHFGQYKKAKECADQKIITDSIINDAVCLLMKIGKPNKIFITGDIAFSGLKNQYDEAEKWFDNLTKKLNLSTDDIFIVPGNHDVNRNEISESLPIQVVHEDLRKHSDNIDDYITNSKNMELIWKKFECYSGFSRKYTNCAIDSQKSFWIKHFNSPIGGIKIAGLNSSLLCMDDNDSNQNLVLGTQQLSSAIGEMSDTDLTRELLIVLMHHPPDWLKDGNDLNEYLSNRPHLLFSGHIHEQNGFFKNPMSGGNLIHLAAGAGHNEPGTNRFHAYSWGILHTNGFDYYPRIWVETKKSFQPDYNSFNLNKKGYIYFSRKKLPEHLGNWLLPASGLKRKSVLQKDRLSSGHTDSPQLILFLGAGASAFTGYRTFLSFPDLILNSYIDSSKIKNDCIDLQKKANKVDETALESEFKSGISKTTFNLINNSAQVLKLEKKPLTHDNFMWILQSYRNFLRQIRIDGELRNRFLSSTITQSDFQIFDEIVNKAIYETTLITIEHYSKNRVADSIKNDMKQKQIEQVYSFYYRLSTLNTGNYLPTFTTNYDMLIEDLFTCPSLEKLPDFHLVNGFDRNLTDNCHWDSELYSCHESPSRGLHLFRIHGCVCWYWHEYGNEDIYFHRLQQNLADEKVCAIFPGKEMYRGKNPHIFSFTMFYNLLLQCKVLLFIGFSFRDWDIMQLILTANAHREKPLQIVAVDPEISEGRIIEQLRSVAKNTPFLSKVPMRNELLLLQLKFGESDSSYNEIYRTVQKELSKGD